MNLYSLLPEIKAEFFLEDIPKKDFGDICHLDLETSGLVPEEGDILVVNIGYNPREDGFFRESIVCKVKGDVCPPNVKELLLGSTIKIIHNACFDATWIKKKWGITVKNLRCTKVLARFLKKSNNSYAKLTKRITGLELPKGNISCSPWQLPFDEWSPDMKTYCSYDVAFGLQILNYLQSLVTEEVTEKYLTLMNEWSLIQEVLTKVDSKDLQYL